MADGPETTNPNRSDPADAPSDADLVHEETDWSSWGNLWQVPAIVASIVLIGGGLFMASQRSKQEPIAVVLEQARSLISVGDFDGAKAVLQAGLEPRIEVGTRDEQAAYHLLLGDWVAAMQETHDVSAPANNRLILGEYTKAVDLGANLDALRLERWALAALAVGDIDATRARLAELDVLALGERGAEARERRNRVLRQLVEHSLRVDELEYDETMGVLEKYRADPMLSGDDRAWVVARQARLRLEAEKPTEAVEKLFIDMRRLEHGNDEIEPEAWGELYMLLGRGYFDRGRIDHAQDHLKEALARFEHAVGAQGETLLLLGRVDLVRRDPEGAYEQFDAVVRDFVDTPSYLPALHGRAQVSSVLGRHDESIADFGELIERLPTAGPRRDVTRDGVAASLSDRHDAALTMGDLPLALRYVALAEELFDGPEVPPDVLRRIASTSREIADKQMAEGLAAVDHPTPRPEHVDPSVRFEASRAYERAAEYYLRHARAIAGGDDDEWATSLFYCGDSYDLAGLWDKAIEHLREYVAGRPADDTRRAQAAYRLAQAYEASGDFERAAESYGQVIRERPRSTFGTASHVPMARCYRLLDREREAEDVLVKLVDGRGGADTLITPDAPDYRDALIALGRLYYETDRWREAVERLNAAVSRYPGDPRIDEVRYWLADSYRQHALAERERLATEARIAPRDRREREQGIRTYLGTARDLFAGVVDAYALRDPTLLEPEHQDQLRFATLYRADCAYELGSHDEAIELYDQAARRYNGHHTSMTALVQIVNIYAALGRKRDAEIAHQNALTRLRQLPDNAFDGALMDRAAWERWLRNRPVGPTQISGVNAP